MASKQGTVADGAFDRDMFRYPRGRSRRMQIGSDREYLSISLFVCLRLIKFATSHYDNKKCSGYKEWGKGCCSHNDGVGLFGSGGAEADSLSP